MDLFTFLQKDDKSLLAQFFYADEALNMIASELDSFDGRKDPERCTALVNQLRQSQDRVLTITNAIMDVLIGNERANRDFRVKFPEDVLQENLAGQLWFGAEVILILIYNLANYYFLIAVYLHRTQDMNFNYLNKTGRGRVCSKNDRPYLLYISLSKIINFI